MILGRYWIGEGPKRNVSRGMLSKGSGSWTVGNLAFSGIRLAMVVIVLGAKPTVG